MSLLAAEPTSPGQISEVLLIHHLKHNSKEGEARFACLCSAPSVCAGISNSRAVNVAPFKDSEFSLEIGR